MRKIEVFLQPKDLEGHQLAPIERVRFFLFASKLLETLESVGLTEFIDVIRVAPQRGDQPRIDRSFSGTAIAVTAVSSFHVSGMEKLTKDFTVEWAERPELRISTEGPLDAEVALAASVIARKMWAHFTLYEALAQKLSGCLNKVAKAFPA